MSSIVRRAEPALRVDSPAAVARLADSEYGGRTPDQEMLYVGIDAVGTLRNIAAVFSNVFLATGIAHVAALALGAVAPPTLLVTGPLCMYAASRYTIPNAKEELKGVALDDLEGKRVAQLALANQRGLFVMGAAATLSGSIAMMSPDFAAVVNYQPVLTPAAASVAATVAGCFYGAVLVVRGSIMTGRALYNLSYVYEFHQGLHDRLNELRELQPGAVTEARLHAVLDSAVRYVQKQRYDSNTREETNAFQRRVGGDLRIPNASASLDEKIKWLAEVDKAIHTKELQQKLSLVIGLAMLIGGILLIAATIASGGSLAVVTGLGMASGILFTTAESVFLTSDSTWLFKKVQKHTESPLITQARQRLQEIKSRPPVVAPPAMAAPVEDAPSCWDLATKVGQMVLFYPWYYGIYRPYREITA